MNEQQLMALIEEIGPDRLLIIIQMIMQMSDQQIQALVNQLAQMAQGQQTQPAPEESQGQNNLYG